MVRRALGGLVFGGALALVACGGSDDQGPTAAYPTIDAFCAAQAAEECKAVAASCSVTEDSCTSRRKDACEAGATAATDQGRTYTPANAEACIAKTADIYKGRVIEAASEAAYRDACERVFAGAKKENEACSGKYDCEVGLVCDTDKGFCAEKSEKKETDACNNPGDICGKGLYCKGDSTKFCAPRGKLGEACNLRDMPCQEDLRCNATSCVALLKAGDPCDTNAECTTGFCNSDRKCQAKQFASQTGTCKDFGGT